MDGWRVELSWPDENFCLKISDFGFARICAREKSFIFMVGVRGDYKISLELFCRSFCRISFKLLKVQISNLA